AYIEVDFRISLRHHGPRAPANNDDPKEILSARRPPFGSVRGRRWDLGADAKAGSRPAHAYLPVRAAGIGAGRRIRRLYRQIRTPGARRAAPGKTSPRRC